MADSTATFKEVRFYIEPELTQCYIYIEAGGDSPIGVQGVHHKTFPASMPLSEILEKGFREESPILWPLKGFPK